MPLKRDGLRSCFVAQLEDDAGEGDLFLLSEQVTLPSIGADWDTQRKGAEKANNAFGGHVDVAR